MGELGNPNTISILISDDPESRTTKAEFTWPYEQPTGETYTVDIEETLSVEFDRRFPVRVVSLIQFGTRIGSETIIDRLFGSSMSEGMQFAREVGASIMELTLSEDNRAELAELQYASPSTPPLLREACAKKLGEYRSRSGEADSVA